MTDTKEIFDKTKPYVNSNHAVSSGVSHFYRVGDTVKYKNTRGNVKEAKIESFEVIERNGKIWFHGVDTSTGAKVWYPEHLSRALANCG